MSKPKFFYTQNIKKGMLKLHKLLNEYEEKLLNVKTNDDINELVDEYNEKLNQAYTKATADIINLPYDEECDEYLMKLSREIHDACFSFVNFDETEENDSIYRYAFSIIGIIDVREKRISLMDSFISFMKNNKMEIEKDEIYKDIDLRNCRIIKYLEFNQDDALYTKNEIIVNSLLHQKFKNCDFLLNSTLVTEPKDFLNKDKVLNMIDETIKKYEGYGLSFSDAYRNIDFEMNLDNENYYIYKISFNDSRLKNLVTYIGEYEDFVFIKSKINQHILLFYTVSSNITGGRTIIYQNPIKGNLFAANIEVGQKLLDEFSRFKKLNIKNENSLYKLDDEPVIEKDESYTTLEYVEEYINTPLFKKNTSLDKMDKSLLFLGAFKNGNIIYSQILENIKKGQYKSLVFTDINEDTQNIIELLFANEEFSAIFDGYSYGLDPVYFADRMLETLYAYEDILLEKYKKDPDYLKKNKLPMPFCLCLFEDSLHILLEALAKQNRPVSKNFLNKLYTNLRKDKKLYEKVLYINDNFKMLDFDGLDIDDFSDDQFDDFDDDEDDDPIYKA